VADRLTDAAMVRAKLPNHAATRPTSATAILSPTTSFRLADNTPIFGLQSFSSRSPIWLRFSD
jgi:hypothetical protein